MDCVDDACWPKGTFDVAYDVRMEVDMSGTVYGGMVQRTTRA
jgi:hypothetical protein